MLTKSRKLLPAALLGLMLIGCDGGGGYSDSGYSNGGSSFSTYQAQPGPDVENCLENAPGRSHATGDPLLDNELNMVDRMVNCGLEQEQYGQMEGARYQAYLADLAAQCQANNQAACVEWRDRSAKQRAHEDRMLEQMRLNQELRNSQ